MIAVCLEICAIDILIIAFMLLRMPVSFALLKDFARAAAQQI
ncbi:MAG: hypothetical protein RR234_09320 [Christensenella sp.]